MTSPTARTAEQILDTLGIRLPIPPAPVGSYVAVVISGSLAFVAGQIPAQEGQVKFKGKVGKELSIEAGQKAAELCTINALAQLKVALGSLDIIKRAIKVTGFVNCESSFVDQSKVINGASDFLVKIFGENGKHARVAVGANSLPLESAVEVEFVFEVKQQS